MISFLNIPKKKKRCRAFFCTAVVHPAAVMSWNICRSILRLRYFFYNPNISLEEEYRKRVAEIRRLVAEMSFTHPVHIMEGTYDPQIFYEMARGLERVPEGGERCFKCYRLRMEEAAKLAKEGNYDYFTTTLSISPLKNAEKINEIGEALAEIYGVKHLPSDFKKKNGYKRSIELSHDYGLYRQNYCGCVFSKREQEEKMKQKQISEGSVLLTFFTGM